MVQLTAERNHYRTYSDGSPKMPHLGRLCAYPDRSGRGQNADWGHRVCGGWYCTCPCHDTWDIGSRSEMAAHVEHDWEQVRDCVYCSVDGTRLYQGIVAESSDEKAAMAALFDAAHRRTEDEWNHMRAEVMKVRTDAGSVSE